MFREILLDLMKEFGINQRQLSKEANIPVTTISGWLNANRLPDYNALIKLCQYFQVPSDYLLGRTDDLGTPVGISPSSISVSPSELELILKFRKISPESQETILRVLETALQAEKHLQ